MLPPTQLEGHDLTVVERAGGRGLAETGKYSRRFDWIYLFFAMTTAVVSHQRQRKSFYYAGLINTGVALYFIADHRHWFDKTAWAVSLGVAGITMLLAGFALGERERRSM